MAFDLIKTARTGLAALALALLSTVAFAGDKLQYFTWSGYELPDFNKSFLAAHPDGVEASIFGDDDDAFTKVKAGFRPDIAHPCYDKVARWNKEGLLQPIDTKRIKNWDSIFPVFKNLLWNLGWFYLAFGAVVIVGASNAVNLTDGLDGLAIAPVMIAAAAFGLIAYIVGNVKFADYLQVHYVSGSGELLPFCGAMIGAGLGFLWYNAPPAKIFMGDTGSLALGGALGVVAVAVKHEIVLAIVGGLFVLEACSVMIQIAYFKLTGGKRIFLMAPIHHHFEKLGWKESTVVIRFWIISIVLAIVGLATLKIR